jgi:hypothetical protein
VLLSLTFIYIYREALHSKAAAAKEDIIVTTTIIVVAKREEAVVVVAWEEKDTTITAATFIRMDTFENRASCVDMCQEEKKRYLRWSPHFRRHLMKETHSSTIVFMHAKFALT